MRDASEVEGRVMWNLMRVWAELGWGDGGGGFEWVVIQLVLRGVGNYCG